jgi:hypothetical protein
MGYGLQPGWSMGEIFVLRGDEPGLWLVSNCGSSISFFDGQLDADNLSSCRSSSIPSGYAACDCRSLPGGPPALQYDATHSNNAVEHAREVTLDAASVVHEGECTPGTYRCRQPFVTGDLQVCSADGVWQISSHCCGPYTCYDAPGDEGPHCQCRAEDRAIDPAVASPSDQAVEVQMRDNEPTTGPEDPEPCTYDYLTCGDGDSSVYGCNHQEKWVLLNVCIPGTSCVRGEDHGAFCVGDFGTAGKAMSGSADRLTVGTEEGVEGSTTLLTVAKDAAASTAKA